MSPAGSFRYPTIAIQLVEPGVRIRFLQHTAEASKMSLRMDAFSVRAVSEPHTGVNADPALRSSRTYAHNRPVRLLITRHQYGPGVSA